MASFLDRNAHLSRAMKYLKGQGYDDDVSEPNYTSGKIPGTNQIIKNDMAGVKSNFGQSIQPSDASDLDNEVVGGKTAFDYTGEGGPEGGGKFKSFLGKFFKDRTEQMEPDEYGLTPPTQEKPSIFKTILKVGVPALMGMAGGAGLLPGALAGLTGMEGYKENKFRNDSEDYWNRRGRIEDRRFKRSLFDQNERQFTQKLDEEKRQADNELSFKKWEIENTARKLTDKQKLASLKALEQQRTQAGLPVDKVLEAEIDALDDLF